MAYQIAFDLYESATQDFLRKVQEAIRGSMPAPPPAPPTTEKAAILATPVQETGQQMCPALILVSVHFLGSLECNCVASYRVQNNYNTI